MKDKIIYIVSLLMFLLVSLLLAVFGVDDELPLEIIVAFIVYILAANLRLFSIKKIDRWWDVLFLFLMVVFVGGITKFLHPLVEIYFFNSDLYLMVITSVLAFISFLQLARIFKDSRLYNKIFITLIIGLVLHPFILNIYVSNIDILTLSANTRTEVYNYNDYRVQIVEAAFKEISVIFNYEDNKSGAKHYDMIAQKMAFEYLKDHPSPDQKFINRLRSILSEEHHNWIANQTIDEIKKKYNINN
jgi:hypothetical protein